MKIITDIQNPVYSLLLALTLLACSKTSTPTYNELSLDKNLKEISGLEIKPPFPAELKEIIHKLTKDSSAILHSQYSNELKPDLRIEQNMKNCEISYIKTECINPKMKKVAVAYRFINYISFYDLKGNLLYTSQIGQDMPQQNIDLYDFKLTKYFIDSYCTDKYAYFLYSGSSDLSTPARVLKFNWNGKHIVTYQLERHIQTFAVNEDNNCLITISSNEQNIIQYNL